MLSTSLAFKKSFCSCVLKNSLEGGHMPSTHTSVHIHRIHNYRYAASYLIGYWFFQRFYYSYTKSFQCFTVTRSFEVAKSMKNSTRDMEFIHKLYRFICKDYFDHTVWHHLSNCLHNAVYLSVKLSLTDHLLYDLEPNCLLHCTKSFGLQFTKFSKFLEQAFLF